MERTSLLFPWGDLSYGFGGLYFILGKLDNGNDEILNEIKFHEKIRIKLFIWPFLLVISIWMLNISFILIKLKQ